MPQKLRSLLLHATVSAAASLAALPALAQGGFIIDGAPSRPVQSAPLAAAPQGGAVASRPLDMQRPLGSDQPIQPSIGLGLRLAPGETVDDSALRYYASLNQQQRVQTEIRRLKRLYPGWEPPADLFEQAKAGGEDEQAFWDLFSADQLDDLRAAIEQRIRAEAGWQPSAELTQKMARKTMRNRVMSLYNSGKLQDLLDFVKKEGFNAEDADIDVLWAVAETYAKTKQNIEAVAVYKAILNANREADVRVATIQKAMAAMRMSDVEPLIAMGKNAADGQNEFSVIQIDITRARISAFLHDERKDEIPGPELKVFEDYARGDPDSNQPGLVAWYYYKTKVFRESLEWFKLALEHGGDAMIAHGLAHSLRELGMYRETEEVAYAWRQPLINNAILFIDILERDLTKQIPPYIEPERLLRYAQVTMDLASGEGAQGLAWYAYNSCQFETAYEWFSRAVAWFPKEATTYGLAVSARRTKRSKEYVELINRYDGLFPKVVELVFPDGVVRPPSPCDLLGASPKQRQQLMSNYYGAQNPFLQQPQQNMYLGQQPQSGQRPGFGAQAGNGRSSVQQFGQAQMAPPAWQQPQVQMPKLNPAEFPVAMNPENPLRFVPTGKLMGRPMAIAASGAAILTPMANEYYRGPWPLVARRVPGVGAMPYERYGFMLLAGWNGTTSASEPHNAETAPAGTIWTTQQADDARATRGATQGAGGDGVRQDPEAAANVLAQLPRVPPPGAAMGAGAPFMPQPSQQPTMQQYQQMQQPQPTMQNGRRAVYDRTPTGSIGVTSVARSVPATDTPAETPAARTLSLLAFLRPRPTMEPETLPVAPTRAPLAKATDDAGRDAVASYNDRQYEAALAALDRRAALLPEPLDLRLVRGWSLINLGRADEARLVFGSMTGRAPVTATNFVEPVPVDQGGR